jgi:hypothetical protein
LLNLLSLKERSRRVNAACLEVSQVNVVLVAQMKLTVTIPENTPSHETGRSDLAFFATFFVFLAVTGF